MNFNEIGSNADNLTVEKKFERELPRAGVALVRYVGYIETGKHLPKNPTYKAALKCIHIFELNHPDHLIELDGGEKVPQRIFVHQNIGRTGKSQYMKMFKVMNLACDNKNTHFVQMLGEGFLAEIFHNESEKKEVYANLHMDGAWSFKKPVMVDVMTKAVTPIPIPEAVDKLKGFIWENSGVKDEDIKVMWDLLFIEGTKDNGEDKNWIQLYIMDNIEWEGSRTQSLTQEFVDLNEEEPNKEMKKLAGLAQTEPGMGEDVPF